MKKTVAVPPVSGMMEPPFHRELTFESFAVGAANQLACQAAQMVADAPMPFSNPLLICGGVGQGKTHLMPAIGNRISANNPRSRICYVTSELFTTDYIQALKDNELQNFRQTYRKADALLIEDIQFFTGRERMQQEFFHTINTLLERHIRVVMTLDPNQTTGFGLCLSSLLHAALKVQIESPDISLTKAILHKKAEQLGLLGVEIGPDQIERIALDHQGESDIRKLIGHLSCTAFQSWLAGQPKEPLQSTS